MIEKKKSQLNLNGSYKKQSTQANSRRRFGMVEFFLIILGVGALYLGILRFDKMLDAREGGEAILSLQDQTQQIIALQNNDTDKDGLVDYDELNAYGTSPFIADSDSDGFGDADEINKGFDPLCPRKQEPCTYRDTDDLEFAVVEDELPVLNAQLENNLDNLANDLANNLSPDDLEAFNAILSGQASVDDLRLFLEQAGMPADQLDSFSDEELLQVYSQTLGQ